MKEGKTLPDVIDNIRNSNDDETIEKNVNDLLCMVDGPMLIFMSIVLLGLYYIADVKLVFTVQDCIVFLVTGILFEMFHRVKIKITYTTHFISIIGLFLVIYSTIRFYSFTSLPVWVFALIFIEVSLLRPKKTMLFYSIFSVFSIALIAGTYSNPIEEEGSIWYLIFKIMIVLVFGILSVAVHKVIRGHITRVREEVVKLKEQILIRKKTEERNIYLLKYDHLTGLLNKKHFDEQLKEALIFAKRKNKKLHILFIDLDRFKMVNDTLGHDIGDLLLKDIAKRLTSFFNKNDLLARIGGDEFLLMLEDKKNEKAINIAENIIKDISKPFKIKGHNIHITCSIGIATYPEHGHDGVSLVKAADLAMYRAKEEGKNCYMVFSENLKSAVEYENSMNEDIERALLNNEFFVTYQPQINNINGEIIGFEALIRWQHPKKGLIMPNDFIPVAEKSNLILKIDRWVLKTVCEQNYKWQKEGIIRVPIAVNMATENFYHGSISNYIKEILSEIDLKPKYLEIEITERILAKNNEKIMKEIKQLRNMGIRLAIDDFGTGYSSFSYIKNMPVDVVKIPIDFTYGIDKEIKDEAIISFILGLGETLGIDVIAEGIETEEQLNFLKSRSCNNIQGYYYSKPLNVSEIDEYIKRI